MGNMEKLNVLKLLTQLLFVLIVIISDSLNTDSKHNVTIVDKKIEYVDGIAVYHVKYKIENGAAREISSESVYYSCKVGKQYHVVIQPNGVWESWYKIDK